MWRLPTWLDNAVPNQRNEPIVLKSPDNKFIYKMKTTDKQNKNNKFQDRSMTNSRITKSVE